VLSQEFEISSGLGSRLSESLFFFFSKYEELATEPDCDPELEDFERPEPGELDSELEELDSELDELDDLERPRNRVFCFSSLPGATFSPDFFGERLSSWWIFTTLFSFSTNTSSLIFFIASFSPFSHIFVELFLTITFRQDIENFHLAS